MILSLYIQNQKLDLFKEDSILLNSSIADVQDISANTTEYIKSVSVPASDVNNAIFKHYYDFDIDSGFDARTKVAGHIELDGIPFKTGKFRLSKVTLKSGEPSSYSLNFWGELVSFKDILGTDKLNSLDLSAYNFTYSDGNVFVRATTFSSDVQFSLFSKSQLYFDNTGNNFSGTNISNTGGTGINWRSLKPSISIDKIISAIETDYSLTFTGGFFDRQEIKKLHLLLDNEEDITLGRTQINFDNAGDINTSPSTIDLTENTYVNGYNSQLYIDIVPSAGFENVRYRIDRRLNGVSWTTTNFLTGTTSNLFRTDLDSNVHTFFIDVESDFDFTCTVRIEDIGYPATGDFSATMSEQSVNATLDIASQMPDMEILEFIKGLSQAFKLVIQANDDGTIYVNDINSYYAEGQLINITEYLDNSKIEISRGKLLNPINFNFQEPQTLLQKAYDANNAIYYGDLEATLTENADGTGDNLDGKEFKVQLPFEQVVYEHITNQATGSNTNIVYGGLFDEAIEPITPKPHLHYVYNSSLPDAIAIVGDTGVKTPSFNINIPSYVNSITNPTHSFVWGNVQEPYTNQTIEDTLYSNYYESYVSNIFNIKRRDIKVSVKNFPLRLLTQISLNDVIEINKRYFRIDSYNINLITGDIDFNLINSFDNTVGGFYGDTTSLTVDYNEQDVSVSFVNGLNMGVVKNDTGDGTSWITITDNGAGVLNFAFDEQEPIDDRGMTVTVTNNDTLQTFEITIVQTGNPVRSLRFYLAKNTQNLQFIT